jgi:hypothetical protein
MVGHFKTPPLGLIGWLPYLFSIVRVYIIHSFPISRMVRIMAVIVASVSIDIYIIIIKLNSQKKHIAITIINIMAM